MSLRKEIRKIIMKLTEEQIDSLEILKDQMVLPRWSTKVDVTTMNELLNLGLVEIKKDKRDNREFWYLTDLGNKII